jgi:hypothetical protein
VIDVGRFLAKVDVREPNECWPWTGATQTRGYGSFGTGDGRTALAHRVAYELWVGPIPADLTIDHLCFNKRCMNVAHMEVVTRAENSVRSQRARRATILRNPAPGHRDYEQYLAGELPADLTAEVTA